jgi:hypothetical protein
MTAGLMQAYLEALDAEPNKAAAVEESRQW